MKPKEMDLATKFLILFFTVATLLPFSAKAAVQTKWPSFLLRGANIVPGTSESDLEALTEWKVNSVRIQDLKLLSTHAPYSTDEARLNAVFKMIDLSLERGFYTIFSPGVSNEDHDAFFSNKEFRDAFKALWKQIADRYKDDQRGIAYDLLNEPHDQLAGKAWPNYAAELTRAIRAVDKIHTIVIEPAEWSWPIGFRKFKPTGDKNTVYSFHFYGPMDFTHQRGYDSQGVFIGHLKATEEQRIARKYPGFIQGEKWNKNTIRQYLRNVFKFRDRYHVRIWCGEFGVTRWANGAKSWLKDVIDVLEAQKVGWSYYSFREWQAMDMEMSPEVVNEKTPRSETEFTKLLKSYFNKNETISP